MALVSGTSNGEISPTLVMRPCDLHSIDARVEDKSKMLGDEGCTCIKVGQIGSNNLLFQLNVKRVLM